MHETSGLTDTPRTLNLSLKENPTEVKKRHPCIIWISTLNTFSWRKRSFYLFSNFLFVLFASLASVAGVCKNPYGCFRWPARICETFLYCGNIQRHFFESALLSWDWCERLTRNGTVYFSLTTTMKGKLHARQVQNRLHFIHGWCCAFPRHWWSLSTLFSLYFVLFFLSTVRGMCVSAAHETSGVD